MSFISPLLGGLLGICLASAACANDLIRPVTRDDNVRMMSDAERSALAGLRAQARPAHMVRYPDQMNSGRASQRPVARRPTVPSTQWQHKSGHTLWTRAALSALRSHAQDLETIVPVDIEHWCPAYSDNAPALRRAFWVGMMSALAKHESTYRPDAVGGGDQWYGLLQIYPDTAQRYGCRATSGTALKSATENLSCAARIMNVTVARDQAIAVFKGRWRGVAADWAPFRHRSKAPEMANWTRQQPYCLQIKNTRPRSRPSAVRALTQADGPTAD